MRSTTVPIVTIVTEIRMRVRTWHESDDQSETHQYLSSAVTCVTFRSMSSYSLSTVVLICGHVDKKRVNTFTNLVVEVRSRPK